MKKYQTIFGVDVSKKHLDICLMDSNERILNRTKIDNTTSAIAKYFKQIQQSEKLELSKALVCLEATGVYSKLIVRHLEGIDVPTWVVHPTHAKHSMGLQRDKNDPLDARLLAKFATRNQRDKRLWQPELPTVKKMKALLKKRDQIEKAINVLCSGPKENKAFVEPDIHALQIADVKESVEALRAIKKKVDKQLKQIINSDKDIKKNFKLVESVTGIGLITAAYFICLTNNFTKLTDPNKFACYCGVVPFSKSSGSSLKTKPRVSHAAHKKMKTLLTMCACATINANDSFSEYYDHKVVVTKKNKMLVINNIRNKLIKRVFAVVKRGTPYQRYSAPVSQTV